MGTLRVMESTDLYNILNQRRRVSRLAELNYLMLIDCRDSDDYHMSHIITARNLKKDARGRFIPPSVEEINSMHHVVVYDSRSSSLRKKGKAVSFGHILSDFYVGTVYMLKGGFQKFTRYYHFLRTEKIIYTITELENLAVYPLEIIQRVLYLGTEEQSKDTSVLQALKITAIVMLSQLTDKHKEKAEVIQENLTTLDLRIGESSVTNLYSSFPMICRFIDSNTGVGSRLLITSSMGRSHAMGVAIGYVMYRFKHSLDKAWNFMQKCQHVLPPTKDLLQQLSDWESHILGTKQTKTNREYFV